MTSLAGNKGFTLLELMLVLVIVGVLMTQILPNTTSANQAASLKAAANDIASAFRYTRSYAIYSGKEASFTLDIEQNTYQISDSQKKYTLDDKITLSLTTTKNDVINKGSGKIRFFADGSSSAGGVNLKLGSLKKTVRLNWLTGEAEISDN